MTSTSPASPQPGDSPRRRQKAATRDRILRAAAEVFADLGFDAASMGIIARRAEVKKSLVQYHFDTKEKLWRTAVEAIWKERRRELPQYLEALPQLEGPERLRHLFKQIMHFAKDHPAWLGIMFREATTPGPRLDWLVDNFIRGDYERALGFAEGAQARGLLPEGPPLELMHILTGALTYALKIAPITQRAIGVDSQAEDYLDAHVDALIALLEGATKDSSNGGSGGKR